MVQLPVITPSTTAIASGETASSVSQIFVTENSPPVSDSEWVFFFVVVAIVVSIFGLALRIALWMLKTALRLVCCSLQWLVQAFVRFLGFGSKGVTKGSISNIWLLHAESPIFLRFRCCDLPILALGSDHSCRFHILITPVHGCKAGLGRFLAGIDISSPSVDVDISQTSMNCAHRCSGGSM
ncbi:hypothetical protein EDD17DRAFT_376995 [Pisolithus thermaeus]|nr:hypothetical protein EDD17DRAFT_376995 [Pisolithus thermaeus]